MNIATAGLLTLQALAPATATAYPGVMVPGATYPGQTATAHLIGTTPAPLPLIARS